MTKSGRSSYQRLAGSLDPTGPAPPGREVSHSKTERALELTIWFSRSMRLRLAKFAWFSALAAGSGSLSGIRAQTGGVKRLVQAFMSLCATRRALRYTRSRLGQRSIRLEAQTVSGCVHHNLDCVGSAPLPISLCCGNKDILVGTLGGVHKSQGKRPLPRSALLHLLCRWRNE